MVSAAGNRIGSVYIHLGVTSDMSTFRRAGDEAARVSNRMRNTIVAGNRQISDSFTRAGQAVAVMHGPLGGVASRLQAIAQLSRGASMGMATFAAGMAASTFGMAKFVQVGDKMQRMANNLRTVTTGSSNLAKIQSELYEISQRSRVAMEGTVTLYARMARSTESLGLSQQKLLRITETVQKSFAVGGATTQEAMGAAIQLSQGIASDRFSGDEFRSVAENAPVLLREMARQLGVNIGKLREMAHAGELTAKVVTEAIYGASEAIDKDFGKTISTFEQGMARFWNSVDMYVHGVDKSFGVTQTLASGVNALADNFENLMWWVESAAIGLAAFAGGRIAGAALKSGKGYLGDVAVHGLFARTRMQTKKELDEITKSLKDIDKARAEIERQIRDQEQRFVDRASRSNNAVAMIKAAHNQEIASNERLATLERQRIDLRERQIVQQNSIVAGLRQERQEALRTVRSHGARVTNASRRYGRSDTKGDLRALEREQARLVRAQENYRNSVERLAAAEGGVFDRAAIRAYGNELNNIQKQLNANLIAQHKSQQDIAKAQQAYVDAQKRSPEEAKKFKAVADQHRVAMAALVSQQDKLSGEYNTLISKQTELNGRVSLMGAAMARVSGFFGSMLSLVGGAPGLALMGIIGSFAAVGSSLANSTRRTEEFRQKLIELGISAEEAAEKVGGVNDRTLSSLMEWQKEIDAQIDKLQGGGGVIDRLLGDGESTSAVIEQVEKQIFALRDEMAAMERQGRDTGAALDRISSAEAFKDIAEEVRDSRGEVSRLDERLDAIVAKNPEFSELAVTIRNVAQNLRDAAEASAQNAANMATMSAPAWIQDQMWQTQQMEMLEKRREAISLILEEHRATYDLSKADQEREKAKKDLIKTYEEFAKNNKDVVEGITAEAVATEANINAIIHEKEVRELLNDAMGRQEKRAKEMTDSLVAAAMDGKIGLNDMKAAMEQLAAMNPDLSSWIEQIMKVATAAVEAQRAISGWTMDESKGGRARYGAIVLPDSVDVRPTRRVDPYFEDWRKQERGAKSTRDAYRDLIKSAQDRIDQMQLEIQLIGKHGVAQDVARFRLELLQKATDKGRKLDEKKRKEIEALTESYRKYATELATLTALEELSFEREQMFRSPVERMVHEELRNIGLELNSVEGQRVADAVRLVDLIQQQKNEYEEIAGIIGSSLADAFNGLFTGAIKDFDDFLDHVTRGLARLATRQIEKLFDFTEEGQWRRGTAANDNWETQSFAQFLGVEVRKGAKAGTKEGSFGGTFEGLFTALGMSSGQSQAAGGALGAGLGGFGMGYQSQDPLMGGLGGALSGAMAMAPLGPLGMVAGAIIGGISGALGGLLGKKKVQKEAEAELEKNMGAIEGILATGEGTGVGAVATTFREYFDEMASAVELAAKAGNQELRNRLSASAGTFFQRLYVDWMRGFEGLTESLRAGLGDSSPFMKAASEVQGLRESLMGLIADARFVNEKFIEMHGLQPGDQMFDQLAWQVEEMTQAARAMALSVLTGAQEFTAMEEAVQQIRGAASALQITLEQLGMAADEAAHAIEQGVVAALHKLRLALQTDLVRSISELSGFDFLNEFMDAQSAYETRLRDLAALGMDSSLAVTELNLRLRQITSEASLTDDQLRQVAAAFPLLADGLLALIGGGGGDTAMALANAKTALDQAKADLRSAYEAEMRLLEQVVSRHEALIKSLQRFRDDLRLDSNLSPLDPWQRLQEAQKQFQETAALALTGDEDALGRLEDVSRAYLTEAKAYYASSEAYFSIFTEVESILDQALSTAGSQLSEAEQQLQALKDLVSPLIDIDNSVMSVANAIATFQQAEADHAAAQVANDNYQNSLFEQMISLLGNINIGHVPDQPGGSATPIAGMYDQYLGASADQYAAGYANLQALVDSGAMTISEMEQAFQAAQAAIAAGQLSMPGYSRGGFTGFGGIGQVMGVVHGQEFVAHAEATRRWRPQLEVMNAGGNPFGSDNSALIAALMNKIEALQEEVRRNTQVTAAGAQEQIAAARGTTRAVDKQGEEARKLAHQRAA